MRLDGSSDSRLVGRPDVLRATASAMRTTTGQPSPINNLFEPVMFAAAYWLYSGTWPEM
ncbi:Uncharacterised protein [Mycobacteroides abscessus subsp. massiliense]|nr:Uncharacterised protein [Mycobacteroides abscessus subsp. massiliense]